jgi:hypothetical protein
MTIKSPFTTLIFNLLPLAEKILLAGLGVGLALIYSGLDSNVAFVSFNGLAVVYFLYAYKPPDIQREDDAPLGFLQLLGLSILPKIMWISCSVSMVGIMFHLLALAGSYEMMLIGVSSIGIGLLLFTIITLTNVKGMKENVPMLYRAVPIFLAEMYLLLIR